MNNAFGLDIGATSIKVVWLMHQNNGFQLTSHIIAPAPPKGMLSESPLDEEEMANVIKKAVETAKITTKNVNIALADNQVYTKVIEMPPLSDKELSLAITWEAEQYIPVPLSSISLVWTVLNPVKKNQKEVNKTQVLVVGAPTMLVNKYQKILALANLNTVSIETEILSVVRALTYQKKEKNNFPPSIILSIGAVSSTLALVIDGVIRFTYSIPVGGIAINRAIEADLGLSLMQAEEYKKVYGISKGGENSEKIGKAIKAILASILAEVKKVMVFYSQKYKESTPIQQILLSGGTAKLPGIDLFFAEYCGIETVIANPWTVLDQSQSLPQDLRNKGSNYTVAIGLAMRGYD